VKHKTGCTYLPLAVSTAGTSPKQPDSAEPYRRLLSASVPRSLFHSTCNSRPYHRTDTAGTPPYSTVDARMLCTVLYHAAPMTTTMLMQVLHGQAGCSTTLGQKQTQAP
jgi:hypothetical protein